MQLRSAKLVGHVPKNLSGMLAEGFSIWSSYFPMIPMEEIFRGNSQQFTSLSTPPAVSYQGFFKSHKQGAGNYCKPFVPSVRSLLTPLQDMTSCLPPLGSRTSKSKSAVLASIGTSCAHRPCLEEATKTPPKTLCLLEDRVLVELLSLGNQQRVPFCTSKKTKKNPRIWTQQGIRL